MKHPATRILRRVWPWPLAGSVGLALIGGQEAVARWYYRRTPPPSQHFATDEATAWTPLWREALTPLHGLTFFGRGGRDQVPRGDGAAVLLVHGFLTKGFYLEPLRRWLRAIGYDARIADIGFNADCFAAVNDRLLADVAAARAESGRAVHLIGHSLGGALARAATVRAPDAVASLAVLGAPVRGLRLHPSLRFAAQAVRAEIRRRRGSTVPLTCATYACSCDTVRAIGGDMPAGVPYLTITTKDDGVADWRYAVDPLATRVEVVRGSHFGLVFHGTVYEALAQHLAAVPASPAALSRRQS